MDDEATYVVLELLPDTNEKLLVPGAKIKIQNLDTVHPTISLSDGLPRSSSYEESLGTQLVFLKSPEGGYTFTHKTDVTLKATSCATPAPAAPEVTVPDEPNVGPGGGDDVGGGTTADVVSC